MFDLWFYTKTIDKFSDLRNFDIGEETENLRPQFNRALQN